jgi:P4 family phage/plasmid primase-like protien
MENKSTIPETARTLGSYIKTQLEAEESVSGGMVISILLEGIEKSTTFYCIKETDELIFYDHETQRYSDAGSKHVLGFCESVIRNAKATPNVHTRPMNEVEGHVRRSAYVPLKEFENERLVYIPLANGILDLQTNELMEYCSEYRFLRTLAAEYKPEAKCPNFERFLDDVCVDSEMQPDPKMRRAIIQLFAYCLWRAFPIQNIFFLIGGGANGKGVLLGTLQAFLGNENVANRSILSLGDNRFAGADLYRKHANISNELTVDEVNNVDLLKSLVSGTDYVSAERKFQQPFCFMNYAKVIIATNAPPVTKDATDGFYRRLNLIRFTRQFFGQEDKKDLPERMRQPEELSGILNLALVELRLWVKEGKFDPNSDFANTMPVDEVRVLYERLSDNISAFRYDLLDITGEEENWVAKDALFKAYRDYCRKRKVGAHSEAKFWRDFRAQTVGQVFDKRMGGNRARVLCGLILKLESENNNSHPIQHISDSAPTLHPTNRLMKSRLYINSEMEFEQGEKKGGLGGSWKITVLLACPQWVGQDGIKYGSYKPGETVELPKIEAEWIVEHGFGEYVKGKE